jgi:hypothetical protein
MIDDEDPLCTAIREDIKRIMQEGEDEALRQRFEATRLKHLRERGANWDVEMARALIESITATKH